MPGGQAGVGFYGERVGPLEIVPCPIKTLWPLSCRCMFIYIHIPYHWSYGRTVFQFFLYHFPKKIDMNLRCFLKSRDSMVNWWLWGPVVWDSRDISPKNPIIPFIFGDPIGSQTTRPETISWFKDCTMSLFRHPAGRAFLLFLGFQALAFCVSRWKIDFFSRGWLRLVNLPRRWNWKRYLPFKYCVCWIFDILCQIYRGVIT